jgi:biopolymer transport protein ExbD
MPRKKRKKAHGAESVELNMAAMLDMAFQLLTFFILTFKPAPVEGEVALRMPQAAPPVKAAGASVGSKESEDPTKGLDSVAISLAADGPGNISGVRFEQDTIPLEALEGRLKAALTDPNSTLKQVVIQASPRLRYDALMSVVDKCTKQKLANGEPLKKLSFVELPEGF